MRIRLKKGKQRELIEKVRKKLTLTDLSKKINLSANYIRIDLLNEKVLLSDFSYNELCKIIGENYDCHIVEKLKDNWGKSKGGLNSTGSTIRINFPKKDERLSEIFGALLGDGNVTYYQKGKKVGVYHIKIAGDYKKDRDYHLNYLKKLLENLFGLKVKEILCVKNNERFLAIYSKELVKFFETVGFLAGDKIKNQVTIPDWIKNNDTYLKSCIRGLIDTDGSVFRISKKDFNLNRIGFTNHNQRLLKDTRDAFIKLGFNPSKLINNRQFHISRQEEIKKYILEVGFKNPKHLSRLLD
jgi:intein/homing endonuclease